MGVGPHVLEHVADHFRLMAHFPQLGLNMTRITRPTGHVFVKIA
jgi:hypothetical protein